MAFFGKDSMSSTQSNIVLSAITENLSSSERDRYVNKISGIGRDPYLINSDEFLHDIDSLPDLTSMDIMAYLLANPSPYTAENFRAYKSTEAYNQFTNGFLTNMGVFCPVHRPDFKVVKGDVLHSQSVTKKPLSPWVICGEGRVHSAHCDCVAGIGEVCTHVSTLLFGIEAGVRIREKKTVTQVKAYWMEPNKKHVIAAPVAKIDVSSAKAKKRKLDEAIDAGVEISTMTTTTAITSCTPGFEVMKDPELVCLMEELEKINARPVVMSALEKYSDKFIPVETTIPFPPVMTEVFDKEALTSSYPELLKRCEKMTFTVTKEAAINLEKHTRQQAKSNMWFRYRAGRITASKMKSVCRTDAASPSGSLIKAICYPDAMKFSTAATKCCCRHEGQARKEYESLAKQKHKEFKVTDSGLIISEKHPFIGASPDGMISCSCCEGNGVLEVKCPFCKKKETIDEATEDKAFLFGEVCWKSSSEKRPSILLPSSDSDFYIWPPILRFRCLD